jgi:hypothetical protein
MLQLICCNDKENNKEKINKLRAQILFQSLQLCLILKITPIKIKKFSPCKVSKLLK